MTKRMMISFFFFLLFFFFLDGVNLPACRGLGGGQEEVWDGIPGELAGLEGIKVLLITVQSSRG